MGRCQSFNLSGGLRTKAEGPVDSVHVQTVSIPASDLLSGLPVDQVKRYTSACSLDEEAVHCPCKLLLSVNRHSKKRRTNSHLDACIPWHSGHAAHRVPWLALTFLYRCHIVASRLSCPLLAFQGIRRKLKPQIPTRTRQGAATQASSVVASLVWRVPVEVAVALLGVLQVRVPLLGFTLREANCTRVAN